MTKIEFDEPSTGNVSSDNSKALTVNATGNNSTAIYAEASTDSATAIVGINNVAIALRTRGIGVYGEGPAGVKGKSTKPGFAGVGGEGNPAILGFCPERVQGIAIYGNFGGKKGAAVFGSANNAELDSQAVGVRGKSTNWVGVLGIGKPAGRFEGDVEVTGDIKLLNPMNADCAEDFDILEENVEPGTVMVLTGNGSLQSSRQEYDKKVAGIISGAGGYRPALVLNRQNQSQNEKEEKKNKLRLPIALMGKVYCKVDARHSSIEIGDLLTTSSTEGHAMKADDPMRSFGAVIGKALDSIKEGLGMIPVLVTLQ